MAPQEKKLNDLRKDAVKNTQLYGLKKTQLKKKKILRTRTSTMSFINKKTLFFTK